MTRISVVGVALAILVACGGGGGGPMTPSSPAPIPSADACNSLGGTAASSGLPILNGSACSTDRSSVLLMNLRTSDELGLGACSGTLIAPRVILTAAHCLDEGVGIVRVWLGSGAEIITTTFALYPGYAFNRSGFDVGVVFMADDIPRNPVPILTSRDGAVGETAIIAGWGRDQNNSSHILRAGSTRISALSNGFLETLYAPPSSSVCAGDSGGPILLSEGGAWVVAGITSATSNNVCNEGTNFYQTVRHQSVRDFIQQHVSGVAQR